MTLNPLLLEGQVHGGIGQGIGQAIMEDTVYDASGQLLSASLMDYALPRASDVPNYAFETRNVPCTTNPLGVKGAGEAGAIGSCPAVMNAVVDALHRVYGISISICRRPRRRSGKRSGPCSGRASACRAWGHAPAALYLRLASGHS